MRLIFLLVILACGLYTSALRIPLEQSKRNHIGRRSGVGKVTQKLAVNDESDDDLSLRFANILLYYLMYTDFSR